MSTDLPDRWADEPWPLDEPDIGTFRVQNRSDSYDDVPQVADLADEAWDYALDHGVSMERALVEVQGRAWAEANALNQFLWGSTWLTSDPWSQIDWRPASKALVDLFMAGRSPEGDE